MLATPSIPIDLVTITLFLVQRILQCSNRVNLVLFARLENGIMHHERVRHPGVHDMLHWHTRFTQLFDICLSLLPERIELCRDYKCLG